MAQPDCAAIAAERAKLEAERITINGTISDIALGRRPKARKGPSAGDLGQAVAGTASSILLPFGIGAAVNLGVAAARKAARKKQAPAPAAEEQDVPAMIARENEIEARLAALSQDCPALPRL